MRNRRLLLLAAAVALLVSLTTLRGEDATKEGKATVRKVHGKAWFQAPDKSWRKLKRNADFPAGVVIKTGPDSYTDLHVNGISSVVRINGDSTLEIQKMNYRGALFSGDQETLLNLKTGEILGNVKKISAGSRYEIQTPRGTASIRGRDFKIEVVEAAGGYQLVTFTAVQGGRCNLGSSRREERREDAHRCAGMDARPR